MMPPMPFAQTEAIRAFLRRLSRTPLFALDDAFVAESIRTGGGVLWPMAERHAGRALITLHGLTVTGCTMAAAQRNWRKMAWTELDRSTRVPAPPRPIHANTGANT